MTTPALAGWHIPADWEPHTRCWIAWPCREATWHGGMEAARGAIADLARTIARFEPVTMACNPEDLVDASLACGPGVQTLPLDMDDSWLRDSGPSFLVNDFGGLAGVHWCFNGWGGLLSRFDDDATVGRRILEHLGLPVHSVPLVLEGGAFCVDGEGTALVTEQCLLAPNRNPALSKAGIEEILKAYAGVSKVLWLGDGYQDDETGGHVDEIACFVQPGVVLALATDDPRDGNFAAFQDNLDRLKKATDARGRDIEVVTVRQPEARYRDGVRLTLSYTNLYFANQAVILPGFEDAADQDAYRTLRRLFPNREVVQLPALDIVAGGGGIHCVTLGQPAPLPLPFDPVI